MRDTNKINPEHSTGVLITSSSRKVPLVRALKAAAQRLDRNIQVIAGDIDPMALSRYEADSFWEMPVLGDNVLTQIIEECHARAISVVLPTRDGELDFWACNREVFLRSGIKVIISTQDAIKRCRDKLAFARFGADVGLPLIPAALIPDPFIYTSLVVKERFGAGSRGLGLNLTMPEALEHARLLTEPVFQPFIPGLEISIDGWVDRRGRVVGVVLRRRDRVVSGESQVTTTFRDEVLEEQAMHVIAALQLYGPVVIQAIVVDGNLQVIECNPRFGGASTASIAVGLDLLYWCLSDALVDSVPLIFDRTPYDIRQVRMPVDKVIYGPDF